MTSGPWDMYTLVMSAFMHVQAMEDATGVLASMVNISNTVIVMYQVEMTAIKFECNNSYIYIFIYTCKNMS